MCGIFGLFVGKDSDVSVEDWRATLKSLFLLSESRGKEASGLAVAGLDAIRVHKDSVSAAAMLASRDYQAFLDRCLKGRDALRIGPLAALGHARLVTNGLQGIDDNNQPVPVGNAVVVHNGIIVNDQEVWDKHPELNREGQVDTEVIAALLDRLHQRDGLAAAAGQVFEDIYGETSIGAFFAGLNTALLATNTGSLYRVTSKDGQALFFASEASICEAMTRGRAAAEAFAGQPCRQVKAKHALLVDLETLETRDVDLRKAQAGTQQAAAFARHLASTRRIEDKAERARTYRDQLRRCTRCILPATMPGIAFDSDGVCSVCRGYRPWAKRPEGELQERLDRIRSRDGSPDCLVAFSGGRDSSMGLHLLKTKYKMTPLAYTYDWGMVTDLARRNQARLCGRLGVEHIWVSADIKAKRANIRRNVSAWLAEPDLGLIPLFMAGDKQYFWHANAMMKKTGLDLMVLCANEYERTDFKAGFLGVGYRSLNPNQPSALSAWSKAALLAKYGIRFLRNPRYLNRSIPDTVGAFVSYYLVEQNYLPFFDYEDWDEEEINRTLIGEYDWEIAEDTTSTWRIGDGTAPFYNLIYHTVAGFSEADTFRSNQIREGVLTRDEALRRAAEENRPRWESVREYLQLIRLDFDETIRIIDRIPKLYLPRSEGGLIPDDEVSDVLTGNSAAAMPLPA
jgi:asparagine synthetase B (glutamine-hydrolysing)